MKVELVGGEWLCFCVKKKVTMQVLERGDAAGVEVCYCCWALLVLHGRNNLHFTVEKARKTVLGVWKEEMRGL